VTENTSSGRVVRRQRVYVFEEHRLALTGSRWNLRLPSGHYCDVFCSWNTSYLCVLFFTSFLS
jgi:hypothetical protein